MRTLALLACLPFAFSPIGDPQKPAEKGASAQPANLVPTSVLTPIEGIVKQLAKGGRERETKDLLAVLENLGYPQANHDKLEKACVEDLAKAKIAIDSLPAGAKQLRAIATQIATIMDKLEAGEPKNLLARRVLALDGENEAAHKVLEHVKVGKSWVRSDLAGMRVRRGQILDKVEETKKLVVDMTTGEVDDEYIQKACGVKATSVRRGVIELRSNFSAEKTARMLREVERARALSGWLTTVEMKKEDPNYKAPELALPYAPSESRARYVWLLIDSRELYMKLAKELAAAGKIEDADAELLQRPNTDLAGFNIKSGPHVALAQFETNVESALLVFLTNMKERVASPLSAGHLNWLTLTCFGCMLPNFFYAEEGRKAGGDTKVAGEETRERAELLRLAKAGIAGSRTWMQYLAERGEDPSLGASFRETIAEITGNNLHKCTSIVEFLHDANIFATAYKGLKQNGEGTPVERFATAIGMPLGELESKWRDWLIGTRPGVAERIDKENLSAWPKEALAVLEYMNHIRDKTFKGKIDGVWQLKFDPTLSEQCALHSHYLVLHPEQQKWPDAHEEYSDKAGYTVEGAWAGAHSVIVWGRLEDYKEAVDGWMGTFYHRLPLIDPGVLRLGWGSEGIYCVMDMSSLAAPYDKQFTIVYPYEGQTDVRPHSSATKCPTPSRRANPAASMNQRSSDIRSRSSARQSTSAAKSSTSR